MYKSFLTLSLLCAIAFPVVASDDNTMGPEEPSVIAPDAELVILLDDEAVGDGAYQNEETDDEQSRVPKTTKNALFYAIAAGDIDAVKAVISYDDELINRGYQFQVSDPAFHGFHARPSNGDTPLIYAVKTFIDLQKAYESRKFSDEFTVQMAIDHRLSIVSELLFHPKAAVGAENAQGHTAASLAAQAGLSRLANMIATGSHVAPKQAEVSNYKARLAKLDVSDEIRKKIASEIDQLAQKHPAEKSIQINYVNALLDLPWDKAADTTVSIPAVAASLDAEHFALKKVKDSVLDYLAASAVSRGHGKGKIICLVGPPGTGKTSIAESIAKGMKRPFARASLGGAHDEAVIRGHNKSYISANVGEILKGLIQAKVKNPVFLLDEIDKVGTGHYNGNPVSALLEALDPAQNSSFVDRYIEIPFDLSQVIFIATANSRDTIPVPLLDRLEIVEVPGYSIEEKVRIATDHIIPKMVKDAQSDEMSFAVSEEVIRAIIKNYTFEAGVRKLTQHLKTLFAKTAREFLDKRTVATITPENLSEYLGPKRRLARVSQKPAVGVVNCLSVRAGFEGATSILEIILTPGKGALKVSKVLENDSNNAAEIALAYVRAHASELGISAEQFAKNDIHIHKPGIGHVDGPSAGIANVTALVSVFTNRPCDPGYAMTGELSLRGRVMAIGGLKEKILAAKREGIYKVIIPQENEPELNEFKSLIEDMEIIPVSDVREVLDRVLLPAEAITRKPSKKKGN